MKKYSILGVFGFLIVGGCAREKAASSVEIVTAQTPASTQTSTPDSTPAPATQATAPDAKTLRTAIDLGAQYITSACQSSGEWVYLDHLDPAVFYKPRYNELRHTGALYALATYYQYAKERGTLDAKRGAQIKNVLARSAKFFTKRYVAPMGKEGARVLGVWARPEDGASGKPEVKLGGNGLGLVGLLGTESVAPGTTSIETLRALGRGLLFLQNPDGSFASKYSKDRGKQTDWNSLYYPGEAALGLTMLSSFERDPKLKTLWLNAAIKAVGYLARSRKGQTNVPADHWALIATGKFWTQMNATGESTPRAEIKAEIMDHALQICNAILVDAALHDARTTPVATRLEGLLAVYPILGNDQLNLKTQIKAAAATELSRLIATQVKSGELAGAIPRAFGALPPGVPGPALPPDDKNRNGEIRIDYVQHALSALMAYDRAILSAKS